jgi:hypothetical protein
VFTVLLVVGLGVAVGVAGRRTAVLTTGALLAGAWILRLAIASQMYETQTVQLYPRTTAEILFCLLLMAVLAARYGGRRVQDAWRARAAAGNGRVPRPPPTGTCPATTGRWGCWPTWRRTCGSRTGGARSSAGRTGVRRIRGRCCGESGRRALVDQAGPP